MTEHLPISVLSTLWDRNNNTTASLFYQKAITFFSIQFLLFFLHMYFVDTYLFVWDDMRNSLQQKTGGWFAPLQVADECARLDISVK